VLFDAFGFVTVRPRNDDAAGMAFAKAIPLLVAENIEIERVEYLEILLDSRRLRLRCWRWCQRLLAGRLTLSRSKPKRKD